ncbi:hypothetical protein [Demequina sp.]|uniref:hypothetical protein n=1 Tax=Demequina sp. TaxID=2050685 RepID=UPI003A89F763
MAFPSVAYGLPESSQTSSVVVEVLINDGTSTAPLSGVHLTVIDPYTDAPAGGGGVSGRDGTATIEIAGDQSSYVVDAVWPGAPGDLDDINARVEFVADSDEPVQVFLWGTYGTLSGVVSATAGGTPLRDLTGSVLEIASGPALMQRVPVAADGSFESGALPTTAGRDYRLTLTPPDGYTLAADQPSETVGVSLPAVAEGPATHTVNPEFILEKAVTPEPVPEPELTATPEPTPSPAQPPEPTPGTQVSLPTVCFPSDASAVLAGGQVMVLGGVVGTPLEYALPSIQVTALLDTVRGGSTCTAIDAQAGTQTVVAGLSESALFSGLNAAQTMIQGVPGLSLSGEMFAVGQGFAGQDGQPSRQEMAQTIASLLSLQSGASLTSFNDSALSHLERLAASQQQAASRMAEMVAALVGTRSSVAATMRSEPIALGSVQWDRGKVAGSLDVSQVPDGEHHLILEFEDLGITLVAPVTVDQAAAQAATDMLPETGPEQAHLLALAAMLAVVGGAAVAWVHGVRPRRDRM